MINRLNQFYLSSLFYDFFFYFLHFISDLFARQVPKHILGTLPNPTIKMIDDRISDQRIIFIDHWLIIILR